MKIEPKEAVARRAKIKKLMNEIIWTPDSDFWNDIIEAAYKAIRDRDDNIPEG